MKQVFYSVSRINSYIKAVIDEDVLLSDLFIQGEISNFKPHSSGHYYFTLKDEHASISCVMFREAASNLAFVPADGAQVMVYGRISVFEKYGRYQLYVEVMDQKGVGQLHMRFEALKTKLEKLGYFDESNKKTIPENPQTVALITSPTGAAIRDMIKIAKTRNSSVSLVVVPCTVQGDTAPSSIAAAIQAVNNWGGAEIIIVGRGGGSIEDLWAFNEEEVARAIFESEIPVISAVGHETDFTIADFTADLRASTPSSAVTHAIANRQNLVNSVYFLLKRLNDLMNENLENRKEEIENLLESRGFSKVENMIKKNRNDLDIAVKLMNKEVKSRLDNGKVNFIALTARLEGASPVKIMAKGYTGVYANGKLVKSVCNITKGDQIKINFLDGTALATIDETTIDDTKR